MHLRETDLNLLVVLDALLSEGSVKAAAAALALSPSATSHALARLRETFGDPLLVRAGARLTPTPRAQRLRAELRASLEALQRLLDADVGFDPATLLRSFIVSGTDYSAVYPLATLSARVAERAPRVALHLRYEVDDITEALRSGAIDLHVGVKRDPQPDVSVEPLFEETFSLLLRAGHPALERRLTPKRFAALRHVLVSPRGRPGGLVDAVLAERGLRREVTRTVASFSVAPHLVAGSDLVATLPTRVASAAAATLDVVIRPPPLPLAPFTVAQMWQRRSDADPAHAWLREQVHAAAGELAAEHPG